MKKEEEPCVEAAAEGRASRARKVVKTEDENEHNKVENVMQEDSREKDIKQSKRTTPTKRGQLQSKKLEEPKVVAGSGSSKIKEDEAPKSRKRTNAEVEKSPENVPSSKKRRRKVTDDDAVDEEKVAESSPVKDKKKESPTKKQTSAVSVEPKPKEMHSKKKAEISVVKEVAKAHDVEMADAEKSRTETDMDVDMKEKDAEKISPRTSQRKRGSQSPLKQKELATSAMENKSKISLTTCTVIEEPKLQAGSLIKSSDSLDSLKSPLKDRKSVV